MPGPKQNNRRVYPDATRQPRQFDAMRKREAKERQEAYDKLSLQEKIDRLPDTGATKQRAKLQALLDKKNQKVENEKVVAEKIEAAERVVEQVKKNKSEKKGSK